MVNSQWRRPNQRPNQRPTPIQWNAIVSGYRTGGNTSYSFIPAIYFLYSVSDSVSASLNIIIVNSHHNTKSNIVNSQLPDTKTKSNTDRSTNKICTEPDGNLPQPPLYLQSVLGRKFRKVYVHETKWLFTRWFFVACDSTCTTCSVSGDSSKCQSCPNGRYFTDADSDGIGTCDGKTSFTTCNIK